MLFGQTTKQPLNNYEPQNLENISNFEGWGLILVTYKNKRRSTKNMKSLLTWWNNSTTRSSFEIKFIKLTHYNSMFPFQRFPYNCCKHWINPRLAARFLKCVWPFWDIMHWKVKVRNWKSSHQKCSIKKGVLKNFAKLTGKHLRQRLFFLKKKKRL